MKLRLNKTICAVDHLMKKYGEVMMTDNKSAFKISLEKEYKHTLKTNDWLRKYTEGTRAMEA